MGQPMWILLLTLLAVVIGLVVLFWVGTQWAQGYFYDSTVDGLQWRAPAAAGVIAAFLGLWCIVEYSNPGATDAIHNFSHQEVRHFDAIISVRRTPGKKEEDEIRYQRQRSGKTSTFVDAEGKAWSRSSSGAMVAIIIEEGQGDNKVRRRFNADLDEKGNFTSAGARGREMEALKYREQGGNGVIDERQPGTVVRPRIGRLFANIVLNMIHLVLWWVVLWLLLRFQWSHALGYAFVAWLAFTLALVPFLLSRARTAAETSGRPAAALRMPHHPATRTI